MRILRIVGSFGFILNNEWLQPMGSNNHIGGTQIQSYWLTRKISEMGLYQDVFTRNAQVKNFSIKNVNFYSCGINNDFLFPFYSIKNTFGKKYDLIHVHVGISPFIPIAGLILSKIKRVPLICTVNLSWERIQGYGLIHTYLCRMIERLVLKNSSAVVSLMSGNFNKKYIYIPDIIEDTFLKTKIVDKRSKYILFVGRFVYQKGVDILIRSYEESNLSSRGISLILVGSNRDYLPKKLPLNVTVYEHLSRNRVVELMSNAIALVLPSRFEERGTVVGEALAVGTPVILSDLENLHLAYFNYPKKSINFFRLEEINLTRVLNNIDHLILKLNERKKLRLYSNKFSVDQVGNAYINLYKKYGKGSKFS